MNGYLTAAVAVLAWLCIALTVLLVGRHRGAHREEARLQQIADSYRDEATRLQLQLAAATDALLTDLNSLPVTTEDPL